MRNFLQKMYWLLGIQFGIDVRRLINSLRGIPRYLRDCFRFRKAYGGQLNFYPCLFDWYEEGGATKSEYFWQDLYIARQIHASNPHKHVDIGSRFDGFVAHVASFREIEVFDIRPVTMKIPGVVFRQADMMIPSDQYVEYCDSLSCLHALEHFGLGRYGDPLNPNGYVAGIANIAKILCLGGVFYLSVPIGKERVEFNAHRVFNPCALVSLAKVNGLLLKEFSWIPPGGTPVQSSLLEADIESLGMQHYNLGIFTFIKH